VAVRLLVALTAFQMTGLPHFAVDAVTAVSTAQAEVAPGHHDDNCPNDKQHRECPPGCPDCHCTHSMGALPLLPSPFLLELPSSTEIALVPYEATAPPRPEPAGVYRPPRQTRS